VDCESSCRLLLSTLTIAIYDYYSAQMLALILLFHIIIFVVDSNCLRYRSHAITTVHLVPCVSPCSSFNCLGHFNNVYDDDDDDDDCSA